MKEFWDERYSQPTYAYGEAPNEFFKRQLENLQPGTILLPAEGEGRNAVHAAKMGWLVYAFDQSAAGQQKARLLAAKNGVDIHYNVHTFEDLPCEQGQFDAIAWVFAHFPAPKREGYHRALLKYLKPGGIVLLEGFAKKHLEHSSRDEKAGGPKDIDMLFSLDEIESDFASLETLALSEEETLLSEGLYHMGKASVVRYAGRKR